MSLAQINSDILLYGSGISSVISNPTIFFFSATFLKSEVTSSQLSPPGSGVPVPGRTAGSKPSVSIVTYTSSVRVFIILL